MANFAMEQLPLPSTLPEVESFIRALYEPNAPGTISRVQDVLQRLQRSPQGWQLSQSLIASPDNNIKFFAALTIIVKLNRDSAGLTEDDAKELLQNIVGWVLQSLVDGSAAFVTKKLCSALVTYFIHFSHLWSGCFRHFLYCLEIGQSAPAASLDEGLQTSAIVERLDSCKLRAAVWFATSLVEEVGKTDMNSVKYMQVHESLIRNAPDITCLLARGFSPPQDNLGLKTQDETLSCFQAWILYAQRLSPGTNQHLITPLRELVDPAINCFADDSLFQETAELFSDVLSNYSSFFTESQYNSLASLFDSSWASEHYNRTVRGGQEGISFGLLMLAYGDAKVYDLMTRTDDRSRRFLEKLCGLLAADGYLVGEDSIFVPALEFWSTFVETMIDSTFSNDDHDTQLWKPIAEQYLKTVIMNCWRKVQWPPIEVFADWDSSERVAFSDARKDVADMLQSVFTLKGGSLVSFFADLFLQSLAVRSWAEVESSLSCLGALSDCISDSPEFDYELSRVFSSQFFELFAGEAQSPVPLQLRKTGLKLIERYCEYFERHAEYLPHALNLLFAAVSDPVLKDPSARAISTLCSSCRSILTGEAGAFIRHYQALRGSQVLDSLAEERIIQAIASIIQAITDEGQRLEMFDELYTFLKRDFERSVQLKAQPALLDLTDPNFQRGLDPLANPQAVPTVEDISLQIALRALRCLDRMAKGMQDVKEHVVDLDSEPQASSSSTREGAALLAIQSNIIALMAEVQRTFDRNGEVVEIICDVYRAGFSETEPGPFVFPADAVTAFFVQQSSDTPRLGALLSSACSFLGSLYRGPKMVVPNQLVRLLPWVISLLQALPDPESDTEVSQNGICFVDRMITRYPEVFFQLQPQQMLEFFFMFSLKVLNGKEPLPKSAAADFWTGFITLKSENPELQNTIANAMGHLGPLIAQTLIQNVGGNAARSELDKLSDPLKKLVTHQVRAQSWLQQALFDESFPSKQVTPEEKTLFLKKVVGLRGGRATNQIVREFWLACRGSNFTYVS
ncbi:armadillo-type protein [Bombardia bombarda]|uniref:Armadillo-type protein n=1 Tax=Bombardia bombarda TaxID=252184 RepID=A0AA40C8W7_9PEZI|nr:armadillo-type protein [Bombardia bombarda]